MKNIASYNDHTLLNPTTTEQDMQRLCQEGIAYGFKTAFVPSYYVKLAAEVLKSTGVVVGTAVGFPLGYNSSESKLSETEKALHDGAKEIDVVMNISLFKSGRYSKVKEELQTITDMVHQAEGLVKVILETAYLTEAEIRKACEICAGASVDFAKTSTGFAPTGATIEAVKIMRHALPSGIEIKASGGIKTYEQAKLFIEAGAARIGTSSGVAIVKQQELLFSSTS